MAKSYCFQFPGTKEELLNILREYQNNNNQFYYFDEYLVKTDNGKYQFGVERGGHSGGYWYIPEISERDGLLCFNGKIQYIGPSSSERGIKKVMNTIADVFLIIILLPLLLIKKCCLFLASPIKKQIGAPKETTTEDKLIDLMVNHLHCIDVSGTDR